MILHMIFFEKKLCKMLHVTKKFVPLHPQSRMIRLLNKKFFERF